MSEDEAGEETYSETFRALRHPIRRKILRMLAQKRLTFSEILDEVSIDSGHLSYHLENLGDLIMRDPEGNYALSIIGLAAVRLMSDVEEHPVQPPRQRLKASQIASTVYSLVLVGALVIGSVYFVNYTAPGTSIAYRGDSWSGLDFWTVVSMNPGQTHGFNITIKYNPPSNGEAWIINNFSSPTIVESGPNWTGFKFGDLESVPATSILGTSGLGTDSYTFERSAPASTVNVREPGSLGLLVATNESTTSNGTATIFGNVTNVIILGFVEAPDLAVTVYRPDGTVAYSGGVTDWDSTNQRGSFGGTEISMAGTYRFEITNKGKNALQVFLTPYSGWQIYEKPDFYYGIVGLFISVVYPCKISFRLLERRRARKP